MIIDLYKKLKTLNIKIGLSGDNLDIEAPKGILNQTLINEIKLYKEELIDLIKKHHNDDDFIVIPSLVISSDYAVSYSQQLMWILSQFEEASVAYNMSGGLLFKGILDRAVLESTLRYVVNRHESLRTVFTQSVSGDIRQVILTSEELSLQVGYKDLSNVSDQESDIEAISQKEQLELFDLSKGPLLRLTLVKLENQHHILFFNLHHIISDGWSMQVLLKEVMTVYGSLIKGKSPTLAELRFQYKDYAAWQQGILESDSLKASSDYWYNQFSGELPVLDLPSDHIRPAVKTYNGFIIEHRFNQDIVLKLKSFCISEGSTLFIGLLSWLNALFYRYTGQEDIILGSLIAGRDHSESENQIGLYLNTLAIRTRFSGYDNFSTLLSKTREVMLGAYTHQLYPFDKLVDELSLSRDISRSPLFDVMVILQNQVDIYSEKDLVQIDGLSVSALAAQKRDASQFDLSFEFVEQKDGLFLRLNYNSDIYEESTVVRMVSHLDRLLVKALHSPEVSISQLDYLSGKEKYQLLEEFNNTAVAYPKDKTIVDLFEEQVVRTPDALAVMFEDTSLTYRELNVKSNQLAHYLRDRYDIKADDLIGIMADRSERMIIGLLGILKSGGAYVPIDPSYPKDRINYIIEDSKPKIVLVDRVTGQRGVDEFSLWDEEILSVMPIHKLSSITRSTDLAYVIYTSGSTGKPKGTMLQHRGVVNRLSWMWDKYAFTADDIIFQKTPCVFDVSVWELFMPLCFGSSMVLCKREVIYNPFLLVDHIEKYKISTLHFVPSMFNSFIEILKEIPMDRLQSVRHIFTSGEALSKESVHKYYEQFSAVVHNLYGPTEASVDVSYYQTGIKDVHIPIGKPIWNTQIYILDSFGQLCPLGVTGEICIAGEGLSRGYLNQPELTSEKFISNPFKDGEKLYKTGDLGKWLVDGNVEYLGRIDHQVKIRGYRIELGEIENALLSHEKIHEAVVVAKEDTDGLKYLVGYFVSSDSGIDVDMLRNYLSVSLPDYMIPGYLVGLESLPLTYNGKIDRKALPALELLSVVGTSYIAPRNETEAKLVRIWEEVLGRENIGIHDNFFALGGHSLKVIQLVSRIQKELEIKVDVRSLFTHLTIESQSLLLRSLDKQSFENIPSTAFSKEYSLSHSQQRMWILSQFDGSLSAYNISGGIEFLGVLNLNVLESSVRYIINRHESLRTVFRESALGSICQVILPVTEILFHVGYVDLSDVVDQESRIRVISASEEVEVFNLSTGPLLRLKLVKLEQEKHILFFTLHHIISDGWSMQILLKEVICVYSALIEGLSPSLPELRIQYKDYSAWQQEILENDSLSASSDYWHQQFSGEIPILDLPTDHIRPIVKTYKGSFVRHHFSGGITSKLKSICTSEGCTLFVGLLASLNTLFYRYTGQEDIVLGSPIAGRDHSDLENQIGLYLNTLGLRTRFSGSDNFRTLLSKTKDVVFDAFTHQSYPFDILVDTLLSRRDLSRSPLFDVMVILQNQSDIYSIKDLTPIDKLSVNALATLQKSTSQYDLSFEFTEQKEELVLLLNYNSDIYEERTVLRMLSHLDQILALVLEYPDKQIFDLDYINDSEKDQLLYKFNSTFAEYPKDKSLIDLFEVQVNRIPNTTALAYNDISISYKSLSEITNKFAQFLIMNLGAQEGDKINVFIQRSEWQVISLLSILKVGCIYVPIDCISPKKRIDFIREDSNCKFTIDENVINEFLQSEKYFDNSQLANKISIDIPAYIIYTSGSTGTPKGVLVGQKSIINMIFDQIRSLHFGENERVLQFASISFDGSIFEIFSALFSGATLVIISTDIIQNKQEFIEYISAKGVTVAALPPSYLHVLDLKKLDFLNILITAGEPCNVKDARFLSDFLRYYNVYGPTEYSVTATFHQFDCNENNNIVPIGKPIANTQVYILDKNKKLLPQGIKGEIYIGGEGLSLGYLNNPEHNKEKFVPNPFDSNKIIYRSGDIGRWNFSGQIEYLGRTDDQVKLRGYRIELREIELALLEHKLIDEVCVIIKQENEEKHLVAYYISKNDLGSKFLKIYLSEVLPAYMIPAYFVKLENMPLLYNGKIDKKALDENVLNIIVPNQIENWNSEFEKLVAQCWSKVLNSEVNLDTNFFDIGGNSLNAIKLIFSLNTEIGINIKLQYLFSNPVLRDFINGLDNISTLYNSWPTLIKADKLDNYSVSPQQRRLLLLDKIKDTGDAYTLSSKLKIKGNFDLHAFRNAVKTFIKEHEIFRSYYDFHEYKPIMNIVSMEEIELPIFYFKREEMEGAENAIPKFQLNKAPLFQIEIIANSKMDFDLSLNIHHIITDGFSNSLLLKNVFDIYFNKKSYDENSVGLGYFSYIDYIYWIEDYLVSKKGEQDRVYWLNKFEDFKDELFFPRTIETTTFSNLIGEAIVVYLGNDFYLNMVKIARDSKTTNFTVLLSLVKTLLSRVFNRSHIPIGTAVLARPMQELSTIFGFFANTIVIKSDYYDNLTYQSFLNQIKKNVEGALSHENYPFDILVQDLGKSGTTNENPLFEVMVLFNEVEEFENLLGEFSQLKFEAIANEETTSRFKLVFNFFQYKNEIKLRLNYSPKYISQEDAKCIMNDFRFVSEQIFSNTHGLINKLELLPINKTDNTKKLLNVNKEFNFK